MRQRLLGRSFSVSNTIDFISQLDDLIFVLVGCNRLIRGQLSYFGALDLNLGLQTKNFHLMQLPKLNCRGCGRADRAAGALQKIVQ